VITRCARGCTWDWLPIGLKFADAAGALLFVSEREAREHATVCTERNRKEDTKERDRAASSQRRLRLKCLRTPQRHWRQHAARSGIAKSSSSAQAVGRSTPLGKNAGFRCQGLRHMRIRVSSNTFHTPPDDRSSELQLCSKT